MQLIKYVSDTGKVLLLSCCRQKININDQFCPINITGNVLCGNGVSLHLFAANSDNIKEHRNNIYMHFLLDNSIQFWKKSVKSLYYM